MDTEYSSSAEERRGSNARFRSMLDRVANIAAEADREAAARELIEEYGNNVLVAVRRVLSSSDRLRRQLDSCDLEQLVWLSVFRNPERLANFTTPAALGAFLAKVAVSKVAYSRRHHCRLKRDIHRDQSYDELGEHAKGRIAPGADPVEVAVAADRLERFVEDMPELHREMVNLIIAGYIPTEIAEEVGVSVATVRRFINKLHEEQCWTNNKS